MQRVVLLVMLMTRDGHFTFVNRPDERTTLLYYRSILGLIDLDCNVKYSI